MECIHPFRRRRFHHKCICYLVALILSFSNVLLLRPSVVASYVTFTGYSVKTLSTTASYLSQQHQANRRRDVCCLNSSRKLSANGNDEGHEPAYNNNNNDENSNPILIDRRSWFYRSGVVISSCSAIVPAVIGTCSSSANAASVSGSGDSVYVPAKRPVVYRVDSTIPPTLLPVPTIQDQKRILRDLGRGLGTDKKEVFVDRINLNNMLQKAVYGTIDTIQGITSSSSETLKAPASFICLGLPMEPSGRDIDLTVSLLQGVFEKRLNQRLPSAIGMATIPFNAQGTLDELIAGRVSLSDLPNAIGSSEQMESLLSLYQPILQYAIRNKIPIIAMGLSNEDKQVVQTRGIQNVNPTTRAQYVKDPNGFIATTNDPAFKLYTDKSLLKDRLLVSSSNKTSDAVSEGNYFAERILSHEAGATFVSQYAVDQKQRGGGSSVNDKNDDDCVIAIIAPINDVRYMGGINGRIPRVYQYISNAGITTPESTPSTTNEPVVTMNDITTILINPTPVDTLSRTVRLRLEIGTGPDTIAYQTKIADYIWFSSSPPVNLLPRVMDY